jgi:hypothetical protein
MAVKGRSAAVMLKVKARSPRRSATKLRRGCGVPKGTTLRRTRTTSTSERWEQGRIGSKGRLAPSARYCSAAAGVSGSGVHSRGAAAPQAVVARSRSKLQRQTARREDGVGAGWWDLGGVARGVATGDHDDPIG